MAPLHLSYMIDVTASGLETCLMLAAALMISLYRQDWENNIH